MCGYSRRSRWNTRRHWFLLFYLAVILLLAGIVQLLWNTLLPDMLPAKVINYGQALGLLLLCRILFGSFHWGGTSRSPQYGRSRFLKDKWLHMNEAEKTAFREEWKKRCEQRKR
jgi:hypothetical protein